MKANVFQGVDDKWYFHFTSRNGQIVATSGEGYKNKANARRALQNFIIGVSDVEVIDA